MLLNRRRHEENNMNSRRSLLFSILLLLYPAFVQAISLPGDMHLRLVEGDVRMQTEEAPDWIPATANTPLFEKDRLWVPQDGKADIYLITGVSLRLGPESVLEIGPQPDDRFEFHLDQGVMFGSSPVANPSGLVVHTPEATLRIDAGTVFNVRISENGSTEVSVLKGVVYAATDFGELKTEAGNLLVLKDDGSYPVLSGLPPEDEWIRWNRQRDRDTCVTSGSASVQHLPQELATYGPDLDGNRRWVYTPEYGYVWTPAVVIASGWSPYRVGCWVWIKGDYIWVSHDLWGWAPHHYGRWAHVRRIGWCWIPPGHGAVYWAPAYVGWANTTASVSWVPLAPEETYYGRGHFGSHSIDVRQERAIDGRPPPVYKNIRVSNAVTTVSIDTFLAGRPSRSKIHDNPFLRQRASFGAPAIAPVRTSTMPTIQDVPPVKEPPPGFRRPRDPHNQEGRGGSEKAGVGKPVSSPLRGWQTSAQTPPRSGSEASFDRYGTSGVPKPGAKAGAPLNGRSVRPGPSDQTGRTPEQKPPKKLIPPHIPAEKSTRVPRASREENKDTAVQPKNRGGSETHADRSPEYRELRGSVPGKHADSAAQKNRVIADTPIRPAKNPQKGRPNETIREEVRKGNRTGEERRKEPGRAMKGQERGKSGRGKIMP